MNAAASAVAETNRPEKGQSSGQSSAHARSEPHQSAVASDDHDDGHKHAAHAIPKLLMFARLF
jgi:hypothetical protein